MEKELSKVIKCRITKLLKKDKEYLVDKIVSNEKEIKSLQSRIKELYKAVAHYKELSMNKAESEKTDDDTPDYITELKSKLDTYRTEIHRLNNACTEKSQIIAECKKNLADETSCAKKERDSLNYRIRQLHDEIKQQTISFVKLLAKYKRVNIMFYVSLLINILVFIFLLIG